MRERDDASDNRGWCFDLGSREVTPVASLSWEALAISRDNSSIGSGDSCAKGDCICPDDHDYEGVIRGLGVALVGHHAPCVRPICTRCWRTGILGDAKAKWAGSDSNRRLTDYESVALDR